MDPSERYWAKRGRIRLNNGLAALQRSLKDIPIEVEDMDAVRVQNAVDLVETALYWLEGLDNNEA